MKAGNPCLFYFEDNMKVVMSLSGGLDSTTVLALCEQEEYEVLCVSFFYGSKHNKFELECAKKIARHYNSEHIVWDISQILSGFNSSLISGNSKAIPHGHYTDETMKSTVVPCRNMIFASILSGLAESRGFDAVAIGIHAGDHFIYPDCRPLFKTRMGQAIDVATDGKISLLAPFINHTKCEIVKFGITIGAPYELTRTCYEEQELACGKCGACVERLGAFRESNLTDPIEYVK